MTRLRTTILPMPILPITILLCIAVVRCCAIPLSAQMPVNHNKERVILLTNWRSTDTFPSTPEILDSMSSAILRLLPASATSSFAIQPTSLGWIFRQGSTNITALHDSTPIQRILTIRTLQTVYLRTSSNDVERTMILSLRTAQSDLTMQYRDTLSAGRALSLQTTTYPFLYAEMPPPQESFAEKIVEPALIIGGAIASLLLFFFIRTQ